MPETTPTQGGREDYAPVMETVPEPEWGSKTWSLAETEAFDAPVEGEAAPSIDGQRSDPTVGRGQYYITGLATAPEPAVDPLMATPLAERSKEG